MLLPYFYFGIIHMKTLRTLLIALSLSLGGFPIASGLSATPAIRLQVSPAVGLYPTYNPVAKIDIAESPAGAALCLEADGPTFWSSCWEIVEPGARQTALHHERTLRGLQPGRYVVTAKVVRVDHTTKSVSVGVRVVGEGEDEQ